MNAILTLLSSTINKSKHTLTLSQMNDYPAYKCWINTTRACISQHL